jgi:phenylalanyl-tRNA synthetase beta chain
MLFSLEWLLRLCPAPREVERIVSALTDRGLTVDSVEASGDDAALDIDVPANRPDCLGHLGLARELSAAFGVPLAPTDATPEPSGTPIDDEVRVEIADPALCPRYTAGLVRDVRVGPSPDWVVTRLEACGLRSVSNVVDASNLVMLELGQPIHFFDLDRLASAPGGTRQIRVRTAQAGERMCTLDGVERNLDSGMLLIADASHGIALAGVIGGAETEIGPATRHVLVEAAHFDPANVRRTARRLGVQTDASYRFERGVDPAAPVAAQALAARLLHELAGGSPVPGLVDAFPAPPAPRELTLHAAELNRLLGFEPEPETIHAALDALRLCPAPAAVGALRVVVPSWRRDIEREADLVEEVARHVGYERIPTRIEAGRAVDDGGGGAMPEERGRDALAHHGFHEAIGYAMLGEGEDARFVADDAPPPVALSNPIAAPLAYLRRSVLPGLLRAVDLNLRRGRRDVRLFEVGHVFHRGPPGMAPAEPQRLGVAWTGRGEPHHWSHADRDIDLYDLIGLAEHLLRALRCGSGWTRRAGAFSAFHPARAVHWFSADGSTLAWGGALHPALQRDLDQEVYLLELALDSLAGLPCEAPRHRAVPRLPSVTRDLSLLLTHEVPYAVLLDTLRSVDGPAPVRFDALDRYVGPPLAAGHTSLTVRVTLQPHERTLTDDETERYRQALVDKLRDALGVRIRR